MLKSKGYKCGLYIGTLAIGLTLMVSMCKMSTYKLKPTPQTTKINYQIGTYENEYSKFGINKYNISYDVKDYQLNGKKADVHIVNYNGLKIVKLLHEKINKQVFSYAQIETTLDTLPKVLTRNIKEIQLLDYRSTSDAYWSKKYNMKNFRSYASGGSGYIYFYANTYFDTAWNNETLRKTLTHESAHILDVKISSQKKKFSNSTEWYTIMNNDFKFNKHNYGRYCSLYGQESNSSEEDFAEAVSLYVTDNIEFTKEYPNRAGKIKTLLNSKY